MFIVVESSQSKTRSSPITRKRAKQTLLYSHDGGEGFISVAVQQMQSVNYAR